MSRKIVDIIAALVVLTWLVVPGQAKSLLRNIKLSCRVTDDNGALVEGASVMMTGTVLVEEISGLTDKHGLFSGTIEETYLPIWGLVEKRGYYKVMGHFSRSRPVAPMEVTLKRVIDPVQMVERRVVAHFPRLDVPVGFDLEVGDWVAPDGKGKVADFWVSGKSRFESRSNHEISAQLVFSNACDGVQQFIARRTYLTNAPAVSSLPPPQIAPTENYQPTLDLYQSWLPKQWIRHSWSELHNHIFRVRTKVDEDGNIVAANYGWVEGPIIIDQGRSSPLYLKLNYYWNPDPTSRSLEPASIVAVLEGEWRSMEKQPEKPKDKGLGTGTVKVRVVDDEGKPVRGVESRLWSEAYVDDTSGKTNRRGIYSQKLERLKPPIGGVFKKDGYYTSLGDIWRPEEPEESLRFPNDTFTVTLRKIIDPVPMVEKRFKTEFLLPEEPMGFDFEVGDLVAPHGKGKTADFLITGSRNFSSGNDYEVRPKLLFTNDGDGICSHFAPVPRSSKTIASGLVPPQIAPLDGYGRELELWHIMTDDTRLDEHYLLDRSYLFRTRTRKNEAGEIVAANYGWFSGDIKIYAHFSGKASLEFTYFWNPDPTSRSLEPQRTAERGWVE